MTGLVPGRMLAPARTWSEEAGRGELYARAGSRCEITGQSLGLEGQYGEASHRVRRGAGSWSPANLLRLHWSVHRWLHQHPALAVAGGWHLPAVASVDPSMRPVWLRTELGEGWFLLLDQPGDGGGHLVVRCRRQLPAPVLPPARPVDR